MLDDKMIAKLTKKAIRGHAESYGKLIEHYKEYLYKTAMLATKNEDIALDVVGDCILKAFQSIRSLKEAKYFKTWITRILYNAINDRDISKVDIFLIDFETWMDELKGDYWRQPNVLTEDGRTYRELLLERCAYHKEVVFE